MSEPLAIPVLSGPTLTLRPHTMADLTPVLERCTDPDTIRWTTVPSPYTEDGSMMRPRYSRPMSSV